MSYRIVYVYVPVPVGRQYYGNTGSPILQVVGHGERDSLKTESHTVCFAAVFSVLRPTLRTIAKETKGHRACIYLIGKILPKFRLGDDIRNALSRCCSQAGI